MAVNRVPTAWAYDWGRQGWRLCILLGVSVPLHPWLGCLDSCALVKAALVVAGLAALHLVIGRSWWAALTPIGLLLAHALMSH